MKGYTKTPVVNLAQATGSGIGKSGSAATAAVNGAIIPGATHVFRVDSDLSDVCYFPLAAAVTNSVTSTIFSGSAASTQIGLFQNDFSEYQKPVFGCLNYFQKY